MSGRKGSSKKRALSSDGQKASGKQQQKATGSSAGGGASTAAGASTRKKTKHSTTQRPSSAAPTAAAAAAGPSSSRQRHQQEHQQQPRSSRVPRQQQRTMDGDEDHEYGRHQSALQGLLRKLGGFSDAYGGGGGGSSSAASRARSLLPALMRGLSVESLSKIQESYSSYSSSTTSSLSMSAASSAATAAMAAATSGGGDEDDQGSDGGTSRAAALGELCELLSVTSEDAIATLPHHALVPALVATLEEGCNATPMGAEPPLLAARALTYLADGVAGMAQMQNIVGGLLSDSRGGCLSSVTATLRAPECIDLAEQCVALLDKIAATHPRAVLEAGGVTAALACIDFYATGVARTAARAAASASRALVMTSTSSDATAAAGGGLSSRSRLRSSSSGDGERADNKRSDAALAAEAVPALAVLLQSQDPRVVEAGCAALCRCAVALADGKPGADESGEDSGGHARALSSAGLVQACVALVRVRDEDGGPAAPGMSSPGTYFSVLRLLSALCSSRADAAAAALEAGAPAALKALLSTSPLLSTALQQQQVGAEGLSDTSSSSSKPAALLRSGDQLSVALSAASALLPALADASAVVASGAPADSLQGTLPNSSTSSSSSAKARAAYLTAHPSVAAAASSALLGLLVAAYDGGGAASSPAARALCVDAVSRAVAAAPSDSLREAITDVPASSFVAAMLRARDPSAVASGVRLAELLQGKLPDVAAVFFPKEGVLAGLKKLAACEGLLLVQQKKKQATSTASVPIPRASARLRDRNRTTTESSDEPPSNGAAAPTPTNSLRSAAAARAALFLASKFPAFAAASASADEEAAEADTDAARALRAAAETLPTEGPSKLLELIGGGASSSGGGGIVIPGGRVSAHELLAARVPSALRSYLAGEDLLSDGRGEGEGGKDAAPSEAAAEALLSRALGFLDAGEVAAAAAATTTSSSSRLRALVRVLHEALNASDRFPLATQGSSSAAAAAGGAGERASGDGAGASGSSAGGAASSSSMASHRYGHSSSPAMGSSAGGGPPPGSLGAGLAQLSQPLRLRLTVAPSARVGSGGSGSGAETTTTRRRLRDAGTAIVLVEPLATLAAVEDFLWPRVAPPPPSSSAAAVPASGRGGGGGGGATATAAERRAATTVATGVTGAARRRGGASTEAAGAAAGAAEEDGEGGARRVTRASAAASAAAPRGGGGGNDRRRRRGATAADDDDEEGSEDEEMEEAADGGDGGGEFFDDDEEGESDEDADDEDQGAFAFDDDDEELRGMHGEGDGDGEGDYDEDEEGDYDEDDEERGDYDDEQDAAMADGFDGYRGGGGGSSSRSYAAAASASAPPRLRFRIDGIALPPDATVFQALNAAAVAREAAGEDGGGVGGGNVPLSSSFAGGGSGVASRRRLWHDVHTITYELFEDGEEEEEGEEDAEEAGGAMAVDDDAGAAVPATTAANATTSTNPTAVAAAASRWARADPPLPPELVFAAAAARNGLVVSSSPASADAPSSPNAPSPPASLLLSSARAAAFFKLSDDGADVLAVLKALHALNAARPRLAAAAALRTGQPPPQDLPRPPLRPADFVNPRLAPRLALQLKDVLAVAGGCLPPWVPALASGARFVFPGPLRARYVRLTCFGLPRALSHMASVNAAEASAASGGGGGGGGGGAGGGGSADGGDGSDPASTAAEDARVARVARQRVRVDRSSVLDAAGRVLATHAGGRPLLEFEFAGEPGVGLGPTLEFYTLACSELQRPGLGMWRGDPASPSAGGKPSMSGLPLPGEGSGRSGGGGGGGTTATATRTRPSSAPAPTPSPPDQAPIDAPLGLFPAPLPLKGGGSQVDAVLSRFRTLGRLAGRGLRDGRLLDLRVARPFWAAVTGASLTLADLRGVDEHLARSLEALEAAAVEAERQEAREEKSLSGEVEMEEAGDEEGRATTTKKKQTQPPAVLVGGCPLEDLGLTWELPGYPSFKLKSFGSGSSKSSKATRRSSSGAGGGKDKDKTSAAPSPRHGSAITDAATLRLYVAACVDATVGSGVSRAVEAFRKGFADGALTLAALAPFGPAEVDELICGEGVGGFAGKESEDAAWSRAALAAAIRFDHGYTAASPSAAAFLDALASLEPGDRRAFVAWATGCPRLPPGGLAALSPRLTVVRKAPTGNVNPNVVINVETGRAAEGDGGGGGGVAAGSSLGASSVLMELGGGGGGDNAARLPSTSAPAVPGALFATAADADLPSVMTCANYVKLPPYSSAAAARARLLVAIREGGGSFDLS